MKNNKQKEDLQNSRHSLAHLLAAAVLAIYPDTKRAIGPAIENGFYYDFEFKNPISDGDLSAIQKQMKKIYNSWKGFEKCDVSKSEALKEFKDNPYKEELIEEFSGEGKKLTVYQSGDFRDLCGGGHIKDIKDINLDAFKLTHLAGAYWRGDEKNQMLTRIYGVAFSTKEELSEYLTLLEEAKKRDHKKLGAQLDLFTFSPLVGPGLPLFTPRGTILRDLLDNFVWELRRDAGYERVDIPHITKKDLYEKSGHWDKFSDELFKMETREKHVFALKPMNCPHHTQIYARKQWSYRELPQRYASTTKVYRDEQTGELGGLTRVRSITQDDAHAFCRENQIEEEMGKIWDIIDTFYKTCGFPLEVHLSLHNPKEQKQYLGSQAVWEKAEARISKLAQERLGTNVITDIGEAAFYGPKIDFIAKDSLGRTSQVATIQLDMNMPERFNLTCVNKDGKPERIFMIHAAIMGSIERFLASFIEHTAGVFPLWLAPVQVRVLAVSDTFQAYAQNIQKILKDEGIRTHLTPADETLGKRIRESEMNKTLYTLVVGEREEKNKSVSIRHYAQGDLGELKIPKLVEKLKKEIEEKTI